mmetsp:Transcript_11713/g.31585  ORF Transcript_11713/g.31585 Transcript_11713/m.31585 type:complete len:217 (-) Transcript_11713:106-756(-)
MSLAIACERTAQSDPCERRAVAGAPSRPRALAIALGGRRRGCHGRLAVGGKAYSVMRGWPSLVARESELRFHRGEPWHRNRGLEACGASARNVQGRCDGGATVRRRVFSGRLGASARVSQSGCWPQRGHRSNCGVRGGAPRRLRNAPLAAEQRRRGGFGLPFPLPRLGAGGGRGYYADSTSTIRAIDVRPRHTGMPEGLIIRTRQGKFCLLSLLGR